MSEPSRLQRIQAEAYFAGRAERVRYSQDPEYHHVIPARYLAGVTFEHWVRGWTGYTCNNLHERMRAIQEA